jgi:hypothetical protein
VLPAWALSPQAVVAPTDLLPPLVEGLLVRNGSAYLRGDFRVDRRALRHAPRTPARRAWAMARVREGAVPSSAKYQVMAGISAGRRREILQRQLEAHWPGKGFSPERAEVRAFLEFSARRLDEGSDFEYRFTGGSEFWMRFGDEGWRRFQGVALTRALLAVVYRPNGSNDEVLAAMERALADAASD